MRRRMRRGIRDRDITDVSVDSRALLGFVPSLTRRRAHLPQHQTWRASRSACLHSSGAAGWKVPFTWSAIQRHARSPAGRASFRVPALHTPRFFGRLQKNCFVAPARSAAAVGLSRSAVRGHRPGLAMPPFFYTPCGLYCQVHSMIPAGADLWPHCRIKRKSCYWGGWRGDLRLATQPMLACDSPP
jgi:hypothetical protein